MTLIISSTILDDLLRYAKAVAPEEACGLLFGEGRVIQRASPTKNIAVDKQKFFEIDPAALIAAERNMREGGKAIIGYFHSHPAGSVEPSQTDASMAAPDGRIWLITNGDEVAAWQAVANGQIFGRFDPIPLDCDSTNGQTAES
ncbi:M67 family metallopeptidase [Parasphingorhabdus sp. JC815]|uniref:M67 family metallopeptidase n=1 Tax=Parasphingorhabdus sp. JC815 TaxID=3232140 RepID=UPI0034575CA3